MSQHSKGLRRFVGLGVVSALAFGVLLVTPATAVGCQERAVEAETFKLSMDSAKNVYRVGDAAVLKVQVTRHVGDYSEPAADADVGVAVEVRETVLFGSSTTNDSGVATVRVRLKAHTPAGAADVGAVASKVYGEDAPCHGAVREWGYTEAPEMFLVRPAE